MIHALLLLTLAQADLKLYDEGALVGPVRRINCVGAGIVCTLAASGSITGVITVSGGGGGGGSGTVTNVDVANANGVSGSVANATTSPVITLTLGAITPSSVASSGTVTGTNLSGTHSGTSSGTNTGDQTKTCGAGTALTTLASGTGSTCTALVNAVEVAVTMPADGSGWVQAVVTGQTWVTSTSKLACQPFNDGGDSNNTDEVYSLAAFSTTVSTRSAGVGFTLTAMSPNGVTGTFKFHCTGV